MQHQKNIYIDKLDAIVHECNNTYQKSIKIKCAAVKPSTYFDFNVEKIDRDTKFKVDDHLRISKYKNIFAKVWASNLSEKVIKKVKNTVLWTNFFSDHNVEEIFRTFYEKELKKTNQGLELKK